ncbi:MAG: HEAT repeat domain-containing protein [Ignavibacteriales bacterium]|nr:HEAT repeat domain-containing protein [Ignavibacteriales bacterium]
MVDDFKQQLAALLSNTDPAVRRRAAEELGQRGGFAPIAALAAALRDENKGVRDAALRALTAIGNTNVARAVVEYISDDNIVTRNLAGELLLQLRENSVPALLPYLYDVDQDIRKFAVDILGLIGHADAVQHTLTLLEDPDPNVIVSAIEALGNIRSLLAVPHLMRAFDSSDYAKAPTAEALGKIGGQQAADFLLFQTNKLLADPKADPIVLYTVLEAISAIGGPSAIDVLQDHLHMLKGKLRRTLLFALLRISERCGIPIHGMSALRGVLIESLVNDETPMRISAAQALGGIEGDDVAEALIMSLSHQDELDAVILPLLENRSGVLPLLVQLMERGRIQPSKEVVMLLGKMPLRKVAAEADLPMVDHAFEIVKRAWSEGSEDVRIAVIDTLFRLDGDKAMQFLDNVVEDPDPWLRIHVMELLTGISDSRIPEFIARFLTDDDEMVRDVAAATLQAQGIDPTTISLQ